MFKERLDELETKIKLIEDRLEEEPDFDTSDEFMPLYDFYIEIKSEIDGFGYGEEVSEKRMNEFLSFVKRFEKLEKRLKSIQDETDVESGSDSDWMFPNGHDDGQ